MIVIDTNVVSEMMRAEPNPRVLAWAAAAGRLHTTAVTLAEVGYGLARLPSGRRKDQLTAAAADVFADFEGVVVSFDARAARRYGAIVVRREAAGLHITNADAQIAAICAAHHAVLATRNVSDFVATGIETVNPWEEPAG